VKIYFLIAGLIAAFSGGAIVSNWHWEAKLAKVERKAEEARLALAQSNAEVIADYADKEERAREAATKYYQQLVHLPPFTCINDKRVHFVAEWNKVAGKASSAGEAVR